MQVKTRGEGRRGAAGATNDEIVRHDLSRLTSEGLI